jgi:ferrous iron transport protein B
MSTWALVGSPNSGKTTLYNWLTGARSKTVNYPGATVEYSVGSLRQALSEKAQGYQPRIIDTPGIYSFNPQSEDEVVTYNTLFDATALKLKIEGVLIVADATQLNRHLVLVEQLKQTGYPLLLIVTMSDVVEKQKALFDLETIQNKLGVDVVAFDGILGRGLDQIVQKMQLIDQKTQSMGLKITKPVRWSLQQQEQYLNEAQMISDSALKYPASNQINSDSDPLDSVDRFLLHPLFGFIFFFVIMTLLFSSIYWMAQPAMDLIDQSFGFLSEKTIEFIPGLLGDFLGSGLITAIGGVVIFIPQIFILFLGIGLLEASGYLARVAALIDKPLALIGLGGRSFVPLLSGFACSIPAIMATRNITSKKEKLIAQSIIPFMTCSARLPVYGLLIGFLYGDSNPFMAGLIMSVLYFAAILVGAIAAKVLSLILKGEKSTRLMMELPAYRRPRFRILIWQALTKSKTFVFRAGPIILVLALVLWFGTTFPRPPAGVEMSESQVAAQSYAAKIGQSVEPLFKPLNVDWRVGFGLISAFAAREVFVSSLALVFNVDGKDEAQTEGLLKSMREATFEDGSKIFTVASVVGIFIFFIIALQCISTVSILKRESGSWKPALLQLGLSNVFAYGLAALAVNVLKSFGL